MAPSPDVDTSKPNPARIYDYWLGGGTHFPADRKLAEQVRKAYPGIFALVKAQRRFLEKAVIFLAQQGIRQFLDVGTGIPAMNNTHQVAQAITPGARIVYVDNDPIVLAHARALLTGTPEGATAYLDADLRDPSTILREASRTLDLTEPVAIMLIGILQLIMDAERPHELVAELVRAVPSGSWLAIAQPASDVLPEATEAGAQFSRSVPMIMRTHDQIAAFFAGTELLPPGVVQIHRWDPGQLLDSGGEEVAEWCGLGRKS